MIMLIAILGCGETSTPDPGGEPTTQSTVASSLPEDLPDVILITLDTTRADRLGPYGYPDAFTETLDALAERGRVYERAYSPLPLTIPSHGAIFTGNYPQTLQIRSNGAGQLDEEDYTLTEHLKSFGYTTVGSVAAFVTTRTWGFDQGFDAYFDEIPSQKGGGVWHAERPGALVVDDVLGWKEEYKGDAPIFAWVHLYDAHYPFRPPVEYLKRVGKKPYQAELAYVDDQVQRLVDAFPDALFVITGDHGESLGEHSELTHGMFVYDATQHVPLIFSGPGVEPGRVSETTSLVDIAPTLLDTLGLPSLGEIDGHVVPSAEARAVYMESYQLQQRFGVAPQVAVVEGDLKLISVPKTELYDLSADPSEKTNLAEGRPDDVARLQASLDRFEAPPPYEDPAHPAEPEVAMQLQALGYTEGGFVGDVTGDLPDAKDQLALIVKSQQADRALRDGDSDKAAVLLDELRGLAPNVIEFYSRRATLHGVKGEVEQAGALLEEAITLDPENAMLKLALGTQRARTGRYREASELYQEAADSMDYAPRARAYAVAALLDAEGGSDEGLQLGLEYMKDRPEDLAVVGLVGVELVKRGANARALRLLEKAVEAEVPERDVAYMLSAAAVGEGDLHRAKALLERELTHYPKNKSARLSLVRVLSRLEDWSAIVVVTEVAIASDTDEKQFWHANAQALFNLENYAASRKTLDQALARFPDASALLLLDANLMVKEGRAMEEAKKRFEQAQVALEKEQATQAAPAPSP